jgi:hypothetical protein
MKRTFLAATAMLLISTAAASASYNLHCDAPRVAVGDEPDNNPVVSVDVRYTPEDHAWRVFHNRRDGLVVSRSEQYSIQDASNDRKAQWQGALNRQRNLYMIGEVRRGEGNAIFYYEWLYDRSRNNMLVMQATTRCATPAPPLPQPTSEAAPPPTNQGAVTLGTRPPLPAGVVAVVPPVKDSVPIYSQNNGTTAKIDVLIAGMPLRMLLDTGATMCMVTNEIAARLIATGEATQQADVRSKLADGSIRNLPTIMINEVRIGGHVVRNVRAGVTATDQLIVSFPVLNGIAPFTIDTRAGELVFHRSVSS